MSTKYLDSLSVLELLQETLINEYRKPINIAFCGWLQTHMNITTLDGGERYVIFIFFSIYFMVVNGFTELTIAVSSSFCLSGLLSYETVYERDISGHSCWTLLTYNLKRGP